MYRIEVSIKEGLNDPRAEGLEKDILDLGITTVQRVGVSDIYLLEGDLREDEITTICQELLTDPIVEEYSHAVKPCPDGAHLIEVAYNPGVMDPVEESVRKGITDLGITSVNAIRTAKKYLLWGELPADTIQSICDKLLVNSVVQHVVSVKESVSLPAAAYRFSLERIDLKSMDDAALMDLSNNRFWLNLAEMKIIQDYFKELGRDPTPEEIAERMDYPLDKVRKVMKIAKEPISLETPIGEEEDSHLGDFIEDKKIISPGDAVVNHNLGEQTRKVLTTLTPREEKVLRMRFGIGENSDHTLEEVGRDFNVTRERIRQIEAKALRKLRHPSRSKKLKSFIEQ